MNLPLRMTALAISSLAVSACITARSSENSSQANAPVAATADGRTDLGHIEVIAEPWGNRFPFTFHLQTQRIAMSSPGNSVSFDIALGSDGCLHGAVAGQPLVDLCPTSAASTDPPGSHRWRSADERGTFSAVMSADGASLAIEAGRSRGLFELGEGPAVDELRRHPELLGIAFLFGPMPPTVGFGDRADIDFHYRIAQQGSASARQPGARSAPQLDLSL